MSNITLIKGLKERFGEDSVRELPAKTGEIPLVLIEPGNSQVTVLMTNGLSDYEMPVPEAEKGKEFNELYFCLPSYWEWQELENPNMNWIYPWIQRLAKYVVEKNTWFGHGHTMPCGKEMASLSPTMKQNHLILTNPIYLETELEPMKLGDKTVHFLAIIPIFPDEMDYKQGKGTVKFLRKLISNGVSEKLDDFRSTVLKSRLRLRR